MTHRRLAFAAAAGIAVACALGSVAWATIKLPKAGTASQVAALVKKSTSISTLDSTVAKELLGAATDTADTLYPWTKNGCVKLTSCVFGDKTSKTVLAVMGDSHAQMWIPALDRIGKAKHLKVILLYLDLCPAATVSVWTAAYGQYTTCTTDRAAWISALDKARPLTIILSDRTSGLLDGTTNGQTAITSSEWLSGMETTLEGLAPSHANLVIIGDIVAQNQAPAECLSANPTSVQTCSSSNPNPSRPGMQSAEKAAATAEHATYVNPIPWLCTATKCSEVVGPYISYSDPYHVSSEYSAYLSGVLQTALRKVL